MGLALSWVHRSIEPATINPPSIRSMGRWNSQRNRFRPVPFCLAMAHWQLGEKEIAREWYQKGVDRMKNDAAPSPQLSRLRTEADALMGSGASD